MARTLAAGLTGAASAIIANTFIGLLPSGYSEKARIESNADELQNVAAPGARAG